MGDFSTLLHDLNTSSVNTLLLVVLFFLLKWIFTGLSKRLFAAEAVGNANAKSIAFIKGRLKITEPNE